MTERPAPSPAPEQLLQLKDDILRQWEQLSAEHRATMALVLVESVMGDEWGPWLKEAVALRWEERRDTFPVLSISRADLRQVYLPEDYIRQLSDRDVQRIAQIVQDSYLSTGFWGDLDFAVQTFLEEQKQKQRGK
jgi:hypothetical protein